MYVDKMIAKVKGKVKGSSGKDLEMSEILPDGWETYIDEASNMPIYYNNVTGEQSWEKPEGTKMAKQKQKTGVLFHNPLNVSGSATSNGHGIQFC